MASNKELAASASDLGAKLGVEVNTEGLGNDKLSALVQDLQGQYDKAVSDKASADQDEAEARAKAIQKSADAAGAKAKKDLAALQKAESDARKKVVAEAEDAQKLATELAECVVADGHTVQCAMGELRPGKRLRGGAMTRKAFEVFKKNGSLVKKAKPKEAAKD